MSLDIHYILDWDGKKIVSSQKSPNWFRGPQTSYSVSAGVISRGYSSLCVILTTHLHDNSEERMSGAKYLLPLYAGLA